MLPQWDLYLEWMVANRQNEVEWILLKADSWADYAVSPERQARLRELTDRCHRHGIACGVVRDSATRPWREKDVALARKRQGARGLDARQGLAPRHAQRQDSHVVAFHFPPARFIHGPHSPPLACLHAPRTRRWPSSSSTRSCWCRTSRRSRQRLRRCTPTVSAQRMHIL